MPSFTYHELDGGHEAFHKAITDSKEGNDFGAFVHAYEPDEYKKMRLFMSDNGEAGFALKGHDIVSVFRNPKLDPEKKNVAGHMLDVALQNGGKTLDCFDGFLPKLYAKYGFEPKAKMKFAREYAPEGWNYDRDGEPDVCFFQHNGDSIDKVRSTQYPPVDMGKAPYTDDYDEAVKMQHEGLQKSLLTEEDIKRHLYQQADPLTKSLGGLNAFIKGWTL